MVEEIKDALKVIKLDKVMISAVAKRERATKWGTLFLLLPVVVNSILLSLTYPSGFGAIFSKFVFWPMIIPFLALAGMSFVVALFVDKFLKASNTDYFGFFRLVSYAGVVLWLTVVAFLFVTLGILDSAGLIQLVWLIGGVSILSVLYHYLHDHYHLAQKDIIFALGVGVVAYFLLQYILGYILVGKYYAFFS